MNLELFVLWFLLQIFTIVAWLSQWIKIAGIDFSSMGIQESNSLCYSASFPATSTATNSASIVNLIMISYFVDSHDTATPLRVNIYPLANFVSFEFNI